MVKEIYTRTPDDPNFVPGIVDYSNEIESVLSQIRMILGTNKGEVLGEYNLGVDLENMVFNTIKNTMEIKKTIMDQISLYVHHSNNISIDIEVSFGDSGYGYDYAVIDIYINGNKTVGFLIDK